MSNIPFANLYDSIEPIYNEFLEKIAYLIKHTEFIGGEEVYSFEEEFAKFCHTNYAVGCSNGTDAIELALKALNIGNGDVVLVPVNTFIATAEAVNNVGAEVDFIDIEEDYYTIDPKKIRDFLEKNKDKNVKAIIPVHLYGQMANMPVIMEIAKEYNLKVIEDSAQAHGSELNGKRPGEYGDIATFSFYPGKNLGAFGDAGAIATNNNDLYEKIQMLVNHGRRPGQKYEHKIIGYNKRIDTLQAAILRIKLKYIEKWTEMRREKVNLYMGLLKENKNVILPKVREESNPVWHLFVIRVKNRDELQKKLKEKGISTGIHYPYTLNMLEAYKFMEYDKGSFEIAEKYSKEILSLPLWPEIKEEDIKKVCEEML